MNNGWAKRRVEDVCVFRGGGTPSKKKESYWRGDIPWVSPKDMKSDVISDSIDHISPEAIEQSTTNLIPANSILVVVRSGILARTIPVGLTGREVTINQDIKALCPKSSVDPWFLFYFLKSRLGEMLALVSRGATVHRIMADQIRTMEIGIPPLPEQRRIVAILDEAFEAIATAKVNAEKNLQNARALFESHLNAVFTQRGEGWVKRRLGDISRISYGYTESASAAKVGPHFLRITDIQDNRVDWTAVPYCPIDESDFSKYKLTDGDIVFARTGATTGKSYLVTSPPDAVFASYLIRVQLSNKELLPKFVNLFFQTHSYWNAIRAGVSGSAQGGFNATKLAELVVPFPQSLRDQKAVIAKCGKVASETESLESKYNRKLAALEELKRSLLHQAFTGALTSKPEKAIAEAAV